MATDLRNLPAFIADDATFRTWGSGLAAQFAAVGLVQTSDTGQINWTTVTRPAAISVAGYEIWRFNDTLQATKPVFIKVEYGVYSPVDKPYLKITVSTATNGAGTPTGQVSVVRTMTFATSKTAGVTLPSYCSGSSSRLNLCVGPDAADTNGFFYMLALVERTKTAAGADTSDGTVSYITGPAGSSGSPWQMVPFTGSIPAANANNMALDLNSGGTMGFGADVALAPSVAFYGRSLFASWLTYRHALIGELASITVDHLGSAHTYMPLGDGVTSSTHIITGSGGGAYSIALLWE